MKDNIPLITHLFLPGEGLRPGKAVRFGKEPPVKTSKHGKGR
jgi:hypothetical protein